MCIFHQIKRSLIPYIITLYIIYTLSYHNIFTFFYFFIPLLLTFCYTCSMERDTRIKNILTYLHQMGTASTFTELATQLNLNRETVRRDIEYLQNERVISRENRKIFLNDNRAARSFLLSNGILSREERAQSIVKLLAEKKSMRVSNLAKLYNVTPATIRNDLKRLEERNLLELHHGYVTLPHTEDQFPVWNSSATAKEIFQIVATRCTSQINGEETVFLDGSPCAVIIAENLVHRDTVKVVTTSVQIATILKNTTIQVLVIDHHKEPRNSFLKLLKDHSFLQKLQITKAFFGLTTYDTGDYVSLHDTLLNDVLYAFAKASVKLTLCLESNNLGIQPNRTHRVDLRKIQSSLVEIVINEAIDETAIKNDFSFNYPVTYCGHDHFLHLGIKSTKKIGFSFYPGTADFRHIVGNSIERACKEFPEYTLDLRRNTGTYETIIDSIQQFTQDGIDLLIDYSSNYEVGELIVRKLNNSQVNIPVIMVDLPVHNAYYYGANNIEAGQIAGDYAAQFILKQWGGKIDSIVLLGKTISGSRAQQRLLGSLDSLRNQIRFSSEIIETLDCSGSNELYQHKLTKIFETLKSQDTCLVMSFGEDTTIDSYELVKQYSQTRRIIMVGQNYTRKLKQLMADPHSPLIGCVSYGQDQYGEQIFSIISEILDNKAQELVHYAEHEWIPNESYQSIWE